MDLASAYLKTKSAHVWRGGSIPQLPAVVPGSVGYRLYLHKPTQLHFLETFRGTQPPPNPFSGALPAVDIPLELPEELGIVTKVYEHLKKSGRTHGIKRSYVNFCRMLSETMRSPCLSFAVDDRTTDFACICDSGRLRHLRTCCADMTFSFADGKARIEPWAPPGDEHPHMYLMMPSRRSLQAALPEVEIAVKIPWPEDVRHANALALWNEFTGGAAPPVGLGEWDFSFAESQFDLLAERRIQAGRQKRRAKPIEVTVNPECTEVTVSQCERFGKNNAVITVSRDQIPQLVERLREAQAALQPNDPPDGTGTE